MSKPHYENEQYRRMFETLCCFNCKHQFNYQSRESGCVLNCAFDKDYHHMIAADTPKCERYELTRNVPSGCQHLLEHLREIERREREPKQLELF